MRNSHKTLTGKPEENRPFGTPRHRWDYNIKMFSKKISL
jgi:hypothetical protein